MYKILLFFILSTSIVQAASPTEDREEKVRSSVFIGKTVKEVPYYFMAEPLTKVTLESLEKYCDKQIELFGKLKADLKVGIATKVEDILFDTIGTLRDLKNHATSWFNKLHYASSSKISSADDNWIVSIKNKKDDVSQMKMFVVSNRASDYTHHIGICQSYERFMDRSPTRPKLLSLKLHGFAASFMMQRRPSRKFMVTKPRDKMEEMMKSNLRNGLRRVYHDGFIEVGAIRILQDGSPDSWIFGISQSICQTYALLSDMKELLGDSLVSIDKRD